jgi:hypothetical protein
MRDMTLLGLITIQMVEGGEEGQNKLNWNGIVNIFMLGE